MNKIFMSVMTIGIAISFLGAGTFSYFTDMETSVGNTFASGVIDLVVDGENPLVGPQITLEDMKPCDWDYKKIILSRTAESNEGRVWFHFNNVVGQDTFQPESEPDDQIFDIQNWIDVDLWIDDGDQQYTPETDICLIHPDDHMTIGGLEWGGIYIRWLADPG